MDEQLAAANDAVSKGITRLSEVSLAISSATLPTKKIALAERALLECLNVLELIHAFNQQIAERSGVSQHGQ